VTQEAMNVGSRFLHWDHHYSFDGSLLACLSAWYLLSPDDRAGWCLAVTEPVNGKYLFDEADMTFLVTGNFTPLPARGAA
jgi:hypothetical protein